MAALRDSPVLVFDCQGTGATPAQGHVIEVAWAHARPRVEPVVEARLVALPEAARLPRVVRELTGLTPADLEGAPAPESVWRELAEAAARVGAGPAPTVIHFAQYERRFLADWAERFAADAQSNFQIVCTHDIAKRLLPDLPRRGLRALAGYFGFSATTLRRSADHVAATCFVWAELLPLLEAQGVRTFEELEVWLDRPAPKRSKKKRFPMPRDKRLGLPPKPGVYRFLRTNQDVLYVGKATSLKHRVNSHFTKQAGLSDRSLEMLSQARDLEVTVCATPLEAALLETDEIKRLEPPYNVALLDERRQVAFASRDLCSVAEGPDPEHPIGPLGSPYAVAALPQIQALLAAPDAAARADVFTRARALGVMPVSVPEEGLLGEGLARFSVAHGLAHPGAHGVGDLLRLGVALLRTQPFAGRPKRDEAEVVWDPERVHAHLEQALARVAQHVARARWLRRLAAASVAFAEPGADGAQDRLLVLRAGEIVERAFVDPASALPTALESDLTFDVGAYDRLRVLVTELKRVARDGGRVRVRFGARPTLEGAPLARALAVV